MDNILKAARLYYEENLTQQEIAKRLNISRVKVYRMLMKAREEGIVNIELNAPKQDFSKIEIAVENTYKIQECNIVPASDSTDILYGAMGDCLSTVLERDLKDGMKIGFGWGNTVRGVVARSSMPKRENITVLPTIGGLGIADEQIHANSIATLAARKIGGQAFLLNCPAILDSPTSRKNFLEESSVQTITNQFPYLDITIVPIGYIGYDITMKKSDRISDEDIDYFTGLGIVGDINSNFIDIDGNPVDNNVQERIINVSLDTLKNNSLTIALCAGNKKIDATRASLRAGIVNILITDSMIGEHLISE